MKSKDAILIKNQDVKYNRMERYRSQHKKLADRIISLEDKIRKLQFEIDYL